MKNCVDILILAALTVYVVDLSGFTQTWKGALEQWLQIKIGSVKPFDCSLCMAWWVGLIYLLIVGKFSLPMIAYVAGMSFLTPVFGNVLMTVKDILIWITNKISNLIN